MRKVVDLNLDEKPEKLCAKYENCLPMGSDGEHNEVFCLALLYRLMLVLVALLMKGSTEMTRVQQSIHMQSPAFIYVK